VTVLGPVWLIDLSLDISFVFWWQVIAWLWQNCILYTILCCLIWLWLWFRYILLFVRFCNAPQSRLVNLILLGVKGLSSFLLHRFEGTRLGLWSVADDVSLVVCARHVLPSYIPVHCGRSHALWRLNIVSCDSYSRRYSIEWARRYRSPHNRWKRNLTLSSCGKNTIILFVLHCGRRGQAWDCSKGLWATKADVLDKRTCLTELLHERLFLDAVLLV